MSTSLKLTNRNIRMEFPNGYVLSVALGAGTYSDNYMAEMDKDGEHPPSKTMEIAVFNPDGAFCELQFEVAAYVDVEMLPAIMHCVESEDFESLRVLCGESAELAVD